MRWVPSICSCYKCKETKKLAHSLVCPDGSGMGGWGDGGGGWKPQDKTPQTPIVRNNGLVVFLK